MIAPAHFYEEKPQPLVFYNNLNFETGEILGDCVNCGKRQVSILEHECPNPSNEIATQAILMAIRKPKKTISINLIAQIVIFALAIFFLFLYGVEYGRVY